MDEDVIVGRGERGLVSVLTMEYRPYNLLGPTTLLHGSTAGRSQPPQRHFT
jgi:hypothetical protein